MVTDPVVAFPEKLTPPLLLVIASDPLCTELFTTCGVAPRPAPPRGGQNQILATCVGTKGLWSEFCSWQAADHQGTPALGSWQSANDPVFEIT